MHGKELHDFLFRLYDYADDIASRIQPGNPENSNYFMALVRIESYFDTMGRMEISRAAKDAAAEGIDPSASLQEAHKRIDLLRTRMQTLAAQYDFNDSLDYASRELARIWHTRPGQDG